MYTDNTVLLIPIACEVTTYIVEIERKRDGAHK